MEVANRSGRVMHNVELTVHAPLGKPTNVYRVSDAVKTILPEPSGIEKSGDTYRLKIGTLPAKQQDNPDGKNIVTMIREYEICFTDRYLTTTAEVLEDGERYGHYQIVFAVKRTEAEKTQR